MLQVRLLFCCKADGQKGFEHLHTFWPPDPKVLTLEKNLFTRNELLRSRNIILVKKSSKNRSYLEIVAISQGWIFLRFHTVVDASVSFVPPGCDK